MIEIKVSQGAKPGHGGILPAAKVTAEIAEARLVPQGKDVFSPTYHKAFSTPLEMTAFIAQLRELSGGKPVGFKICVGDPREFMGIVKAMIQTGIYADFIVVDGGEGGTGAAPLEFSDSLGAPLNEGLLVVQNTLVGAGIRDRFKIGASGKMVTASAMARSMALGADWCNSARAFMFAVGCIQSQRCHTNRCPVGVTTQDPKLQRALIVPDKAERVHNFHRNTVHALAEMIAAMGLDHTSELRPYHAVRRVTQFQALALDEIYPLSGRGQFLDGTAVPRFQTSGTRHQPSPSALVSGRAACTPQLRHAPPRSSLRRDDAAACTRCRARQWSWVSVGAQLGGRARQSRCSSRARRTASLRLVTPSFSKIRRTCVRTVFTEMKSAAAISSVLNSADSSSEDLELTPGECRHQLRYGRNGGWIDGRGERSDDLVSGAERGRLGTIVALDSRASGGTAAVDAVKDLHPSLGWQVDSSAWERPDANDRSRLCQLRKVRGHQCSSLGVAAGPQPVHR